MKQLRFSSFRQRLNAAFLAVSLVPLLLCSALLLQIFRLRMTADQQQNAQQQLDGACYAVDTMHEGLASAAAALQKSRTVLRALSGGQADSAAVYSVLFDATEPVRRFARFDLYDAAWDAPVFHADRAGGADALYLLGRFAGGGAGGAGRDCLLRKRQSARA